MYEYRDVIKHTPSSMIYLLISDDTLEKSHINASSVVFERQQQPAFVCIKYHILTLGRTRANIVAVPISKLNIYIGIKKVAMVCSGRFVHQR